MQEEILKLIQEGNIMDFEDTTEKYKVFFIDNETSTVLQEILVEAESEYEAEVIAESYFDYEHYGDIDYDCEVKYITDENEMGYL